MSLSPMHVHMHGHMHGYMDVWMDGHMGTWTPTWAISTVALGWLQCIDERECMVEQWIHQHWQYDPLGKGGSPQLEHTVQQDVQGVA